MTRPVTRFTVQPRLPAALEPLDRPARNLAWTWDHDIAALLREVDPEGLDRNGGNPVAMLATAAPGRLAQLAGDAVFAARVEAASQRLAERLGRPGAFDARDDVPRVAYFSPEFGVGAVLPQYSGGLGVLAGDHLKAASDLGLDLIGVGLFYREGYFRQILTATGRQLEEYPDLDRKIVG